MELEEEKKKRDSPHEMLFLGCGGIRVWHMSSVACVCWRVHTFFVDLTYGVCFRAVYIPSNPASADRSEG